MDARKTLEEFARDSLTRHGVREAIRHVLADLDACRAELGIDARRAERAEAARDEAEERLSAAQSDFADQLGRAKRDLAGEREAGGRIRDTAENLMEYARMLCFALTDHDKPHQDHAREMVEAWCSNVADALAGRPARLLPPDECHHGNPLSGDCEKCENEEGPCDVAAWVPPRLPTPSEAVRELVVVRAKLAEMMGAKSELDDAWKATGVMGASRGFAGVVLADVVETTREERDALRAQLAEERGRPAEMLAIGSHHCELDGCDGVCWGAIRARGAKPAPMEQLSREESEGELHEVIYQRDKEVGSLRAELEESQRALADCRHALELRAADVLGLRAELAKVTAERDNALAGNSDKTWCAYCGDVAPAPVTFEMIQEHVQSCSKHPMRSVVSERDGLRLNVERMTKTLDTQARDLETVFAKRDALKAKLADAERESVLHGEALTIEVDAHAETTRRLAASEAREGRAREALNASLDYDRSAGPSGNQDLLERWKMLRSEALADSPPGRCPDGCEGIEVVPGEFSGCGCPDGKLANGQPTPAGFQCDCPNHPRLGLWLSEEKRAQVAGALGRYIHDPADGDHVVEALAIVGGGK